MSYSPPQGSSVTHTRLRDPSHTADISGMCAACTSDCPGPCQIGLSALRGPEAILPYQADRNQFASEKRYPLDWSHFSVNGRVFGVRGAANDHRSASYPSVDLTSSFGLSSPVPVSAPFILPAMAKLAWKEYFAGAALFGVPVVIGEDVIAKDGGLVLDGTTVGSAPLVADMVDSFRRYDRGRGDIVLQANEDDELHGLLEYAIAKLGVRSVELKFGQAAKGIQGMGPLPSIEEARRFKALGYLVFPDPDDPEVQDACGRGHGPRFERVGKLPLWTPEGVVQRVAELKSLGAQRVCLKTGPFDPRDLKTILDIASESGADLVTLDGAGGGTGSSPVTMMNEWGIPTVTLEAVTLRLLAKIKAAGKPLPPVALAGGFALEDSVFKALAIGAPHVGTIALGRAAMAAAMVGKQLGAAIQDGALPKEYSRFGSTADEVFADLSALKAQYGSRADFPVGAVGVYSYLRRVAVGVRMLMALNRVFSLAELGPDCVVPITDAAARETGLPTYLDRADRL